MYDFSNADGDKGSKFVNIFFEAVNHHTMLGDGLRDATTDGAKMSIAIHSLLVHLLEFGVLTYLVKISIDKISDRLQKDKIDMYSIPSTPTESYVPLVA